MNQNDALAQAYLFFQHGKFTAAHALLQPLAQSHSATPDLLHLAGAAAAAVGLHGEALSWLRRALAAAPGNLAISYKLARVLVDVGQRQEALSIYLQLMVDGVEHADIYCAAAVLLREFQRDQEALQAIAKALQLAPQSPDSWYLQALLQVRLEQLPAAAESLQQAIALAPAQAQYHLDLALTWHALHRDEAALGAIEQALALEPQAVAAWNARAAILSRLCRYEESIASGKRALLLQPEDADASVNLALSLLTLGQMEPAWPLYEARWQAALADPLRHQQIARWSGTTALRGKTILIWSEQGFGDTVQFCRYVTAVAALGARVVFEVPDRLRALLRTLTRDDQTDTDAISVVAIGDALPAVDYQIPLMSLPLLFNTQMASIPAASAYLSSDAHKRAAWQELLPSEPAGAPPRLRIGIACSGNVGNRRDGLRSVPLAAFAPLLESIDADFYLIQPELRQADYAFLQDATLLQWPGRQLQDFDDTAALLVNLDLLICVDTAVAHLAGALGVPVWIMLGQAADWRWFRERDDSPWYPSARLFRQAQTGNWTELVERIRHTLVGDLRTESAS
jgi:tetratricopeptide (TPR) repeat protein